jgi:hypothetical protein
MPRGDGTGPRGMGAGTGRGLGGCTVTGAGAAGKSRVPGDRSPNFPQVILGSGSRSGGAVRDRDERKSVTIWDVLFSWLELISRKK